MMQFIPVLFCLIAIVSTTTALLPAGLLFASPPEEKLPELSKPQLHREKTKLEKAVDQAAAMLLQGKLPPTEDGVRFALWLYGEKGDVAYLDIATRMARELVKTDAVTGCTALYWVAQAGGPTLHEASTESDEREDAGIHTFPQLIEEYARLAATRDATVPRWLTLQLDKGLSWRVIQLRTIIEELQFSGGYSDGALAKQLQDHYWNEKSALYVDDSVSKSWRHRDNARAALVTWEAGVFVGDADLRKRGQQALESDLEAALQDTNAAAIAGLAAGRMSRRHLQLAIIGDPQDSTITALRQAAYFLFEPNKIILNLDPKTDSKRMAELMYSPDVAPAMFVCVETLCSPPIKDPAELEKQVAEIKKLAAEVQQ